MLFISRRRLWRAGEKARLMLTRRMSLGRASNIDPDSLSTLSMLLFNGLMAEAFCGLRLCSVEGCVWLFRGLGAGDLGLVLASG